ncbi:SDR family NAD(P)-dependent oxidoreductase [Microbacterium jepli]|uniref:SDR family NAD(P)-dependent oxidoreductase n=1 Tax=Microbacterium sp. 1P10UE TaxID=3132288 RepID=UPI0039A0F92E
MTDEAVTAGALEGRRALVTGAGSGLGRSIACELARHGAETILVGRTRSTLEAVAAVIGPASEVQVADVGDAAEVERLAAALHGREPDLLVNNAGIGGPVANLVDIEPDAWDEVFRINVRGVYLMCRAFAPAMVARGAGDIINLASVTGKRPLVGRTPYAASKMAVIGLTATLAFELGQSGVRVNTLSPGPVDGDRMRRNFALESARSGITLGAAEEDFVSRSALRRMVTEQEVADAVVAMLAFPAMTGADIDLSAGMIAR